MAHDPKTIQTQFPNQPGVYQMLNRAGKIIYVGKARNLKNRVSSYFRSHLMDRKTQALMSKVVDIQFTITNSENEALLLEANLIKQYHPRYNVLLRDDKSYPYLYFSTHQDFPRLDFHRGAKRGKGRYFGPFPNAGSVRDNLALIQKLFKIRQCSDIFFRNRTRPCLQYQIKRCTAPCVGYVNKIDYQLQVKHAILFLEGKNEQVIKRMTDKMESASKNLHYEHAAIYRDQISRIRKLQAKQSITCDQGNVDVLGVATKLGRVAIAVLFVRAGRVIGHKTFFPNVPADTDASAALEAFIPQYYLSSLRGEDIVDRIVLSESLPDKVWIQNALQEKLAHKIIISDRKHRKYSHWQTMAKTNAVFALAQRLSEKNDVMMRLVELQHALKLVNAIQRIECYDVSHTMGEATVASCVVFGVDGPIKKDYRRFNIKNIKPGDDYAALKQTLMRRYTRLKSGDGVLPDLIMIDGGRGQLRQAAEVLEELQVTGVILMAIAKGRARKPGEETLFIWGRDAGMHLASDHLGLHLIQFIRDEAHRFAITAHRAKRALARSHSPLEAIEGIGVKRRRDLLRYFGGLQELRRASIAEIGQVSGISEALAKRIYDALR